MTATLENFLEEYERNAMFGLFGEGYTALEIREQKLPVYPRTGSRLGREYREYSQDELRELFNKGYRLSADKTFIESPHGWAPSYDFSGWDRLDSHYGAVVILPPDTSPYKEGLDPKKTKVFLAHLRENKANWERRYGKDLPEALKNGNVAKFFKNLQRKIEDIENKELL